MSDVQEHPLYKRALACTTEELNLTRESVCVLPRAVLGSAPSVPAGMLPSVGGVCACGVEGVCGAFGC